MSENTNKIDIYYLSLGTESGGSSIYGKMAELTKDIIFL